jgi:hypothetical protein
LGAWIPTVGWARFGPPEFLAAELKKKANEVEAFNAREGEVRAWSIRPEDYEILFPETRVARCRLGRRAVGITVGLTATLTKFLMAHRIQIWVSAEIHQGLKRSATGHRRSAATRPLSAS